MSTSKDTMAWIEDQLLGLDVSSKAMFGEYALYCDGKVVAFVCDDTVFIKPSAVDPSILEGTYPAPAYPGSKDYHAVPGELVENRDWFRVAIQSTADVLPMPAPKKARAPRKTATP